MADKINFNDFFIEVEIIDVVLGRWAIVDYAETDSSKMTYLRNRDQIQPKLIAGTNITINSETNEISSALDEAGILQMISGDADNALGIGSDDKLYSSLAGVLKDRGSVPTRAELPSTASNFDAWMILTEQRILFAYNDLYMGLMWFPLNFYADMDLYAKKTEVAEDISGVVPKTRTIAGTSLESDISASTLRSQLNVEDGSQKNVQSDWNAVSGDAYIQNKPAIPVIPDLSKTDSGTGKVVTGLSVSGHAITVSKGDLTASDVGARPDNWSPDIPEYSVVVSATEEGFFKSYSLTKDSVEIGVKINIPKDVVLSSGELKTVVTQDVPYSGAMVGDKYLELVLNDPQQGLIFIPVKDLIDVYTADGVTITLTGNSFSLHSDYKDKIDGIDSGAQKNVQSDWNATEGDSVILNKPSIPSIPDITKTDSGTGRVVTGLTASGHTITVTKGDLTASDVGARPDSWMPNFSELFGDKPPANAQKNVKSDWNETDSSSDAYIKNKPTEALALLSSIPALIDLQPILLMEDGTPLLGEEGKAILLEDAYPYLRLE